MKKNLLFLILPVVALILEMLPYGAVCIFANSQGEKLRATYSYFNMLPFGYANFAPFITAIITCITFLFLVIYCFTEKYRFVVIARLLLSVCVVISLLPLLYGVDFFSVVGALITITLATELLLLIFAIHPQKK